MYTFSRGLNGAGGATGGVPDPLLGGRLGGGRPGNVEKGVG